LEKGYLLLLGSSLLLLLGSLSSSSGGGSSLGLQDLLDDLLFLNKESANNAKKRGKGGKYRESNNCSYRLRTQAAQREPP
jgi:hypothetical protein